MIFVVLVVATMLVATAVPINALVPTGHQNLGAPTRRPATTAPISTAQVTALASQTEWERAFAGEGYAVARCAQQTSDGGYVVTGVTAYPGPVMVLILLVKTDPAGNQEWNKTYGGAGAQEAFSVEQTSDGGYILAGYTNSFGAGYLDFWLVKTNSSGDQQWNRTFGGTGDELSHCAHQTSDGGYIIAGDTNSFGAGGLDFWLVKTNSSGDQQWNRTFGGLNTDTAYWVEQTSDGGYVMAGFTASFGAGDDDIWLVKTNSTGNQEWNMTYGRTKGDWAFSVEQTSDHGYVIAGPTWSFDPNYPDMWLVKTDPVGHQEWNKTFGGARGAMAHSVQQTSDGGYILAGCVWPFGSGYSDVYLVKTDSSGVMQGSKTYGGYYDDEAYSVRQTSDGGYIVAGYTVDATISSSMLLIKTAEITASPTPMVLIESGAAVAAVIIALFVFVLMKRNKHGAIA